MDYCDMYNFNYPGIYKDKYDCLGHYLKVPPKNWIEDKCKDLPYKPEYAPGDRGGKIIKQS